MGCLLSEDPKSGPDRMRIAKGRISSLLLADIIDSVTSYNQTGILLIATNPVDILSYYSWKRSGWPAGRIIGTGTLLDSARLRFLVGQHFQIDPRSVHAHIIGEYGDSELAVWSLANIAGTKVQLDPLKKQEIYQNTRDAAYQIIKAKGSTYYAIALAIDRICAAILHDESAVLTVSTLMQSYHGISDVY